LIITYLGRYPKNVRSTLLDAAQGVRLRATSSSPAASQKLVRKW
jgi:hypothetical protein